MPSRRRSPRPPDDKLTTLIGSLPPSSTYFSLEFFPPKTQNGFTNLQARLARMTTAFKPLFVTVTWGAGGSTATKSLELAEICQRQLGVPTVLHLTCTNMNQKLIDEALEECRSCGIRNILALRGDPPREEYNDTPNDSESPHTDADEQDFVWAVDLVRYIRKKHGDYFCIGIAGYPEGHADESHPEAGKQNVEKDLPYLAEKAKAGADFIMTQLTYDADAYKSYEHRLRNYVDEESNQQIFKDIPIIPGLMPIQSYQIVRRITKLSHAKLPEDIARRIEEVKNDDELVKKVGVDIISELVEKIKASPQPDGLPRGLHFYTLNLEKSVAFILERCRLLPMSESESCSEDSDVAVEGTESPAQTNGSSNHPNLEKLRQTKRRTSSVNAQPHNRVILDLRSRTKSPNGDLPESELQHSSITSKHSASDTGSGIPASRPSRSHNLLISEGQGSLGREATWDDFPNGRWGPSDSPAFGEIDGYGPSLKVGPITARRLWGHPTTPQDITNLFRKHVTGELHAVPWSDDVDADGVGNTGEGALRAETEIIKPRLLDLIEKKGYLTLASQPAVDGVSSSHPIFGWGPKGDGFVFQKAFVEFFCPGEAWPALREKLVAASQEDVSWLKIDATGSFESTDTYNEAQHLHIEGDSSKRIPGTSGINAVTWGVFKGKEIITPTIIETESFRAWGDEAYSIWQEWRRCFPCGSKEEQCLEKLRNSLVLVNVVGQRYRENEGQMMWEFLLSD